jgi:hypothetical protein
MDTRTLKRLGTGFGAAVAALGLAAAATAASAAGPAATHATSASVFDPPGKQAIADGEGQDAEDVPCLAGVRRMRGLGRACPVRGGLLKVDLRNGDAVLTHAGADPMANGSSRMLPGSPRKPRCGASTSQHFRAVIAMPSDVTGDKTAASLRSDIDKVNGAFFASAVESGSTNGADLVFLCDSTGAVQVDVVRLPTALAQTTFSSIVSDLKARGYSSTAEKYAIYFDTRVTGETCGRGTFQGDTTDAASNRNNVGSSYAVEYDCEDPETLLHEMGHNLGAVQAGMPYSTGSGMHCWEGYDVMCYNDNGSTDPGYIQWNCPQPDRFDCGHDTYFDAKLGAGQGGVAGSYIDRNWNIGDCYVAFVLNYACVTTDTTAPAMTSLGRTLTQDSQIDDSGRVPVDLSWGAGDDVGVMSYSAFIRPSGGAWETISLDASRRATRMLTPGTTYEVGVRAFDAAGNASDWRYLTIPVSAHQETSSAVSFYGSWSYGSWSPAFGGAVEYTPSTSAWTDFTFTGSQVAWIGSKGTNRGEAYVWLDGAYIGRFDQYSSTTRARTIVLARDVDPTRQHLLQIQPVGTSSRPTIDVDAYVVLG